MMLASLAAGEVSVQPETEPVKLPAAVEHVMRQLVLAKSGLRIGMPAKEAKKALAESAHMFGVHVLPLESTPFGLPGWKGNVFVYLFDPKDHKILDEFHVVLYCPPFDRKALTAHVLEVGRKLGRDLVIDPNEDGLIWEPTATGPYDFSVSLAGEGVILFEADLNDR